MKRIIAILMLSTTLLALTACDININIHLPSTPAPQESLAVTSPTLPAEEAPPTTIPADPVPTNPVPPTAPSSEPEYADGRIIVEAENPVDSYVDLETRMDDNGYPYDHTNRRVDPEHKVQFFPGSTTCIIFSAFDEYTYTFEVEEAGTYSFRVLGSCNRDTPVDFKINNGYDDWGFFVRNDYMGYDEVELSIVELEAGTNTITLKIIENKDHNFWIDCFFFVPCAKK